MKDVTRQIRPGGKISGYMQVPGDKSISIRSVLLSAIADGASVIKNYGTGKDIHSAIKCISQLGIRVEPKKNVLKVYGNGLHGFSPSKEPIDCGNSGTTLRLLTGILVGQQHEYVVTGDSSLQQRPMRRIVDPLRLMGADIRYLKNEGYIPFMIKPSGMHNIFYKLPIASAQVKSCLLLAGMYGDGATIEEPERSRNHTELMLKARGVDLETQKLTTMIKQAKSIFPEDMEVPGDPSSAAFFVVLATLLPNSELRIRDVCVNETRSGIIDILRQMGADITISKAKKISGEPVADIEVKSSELRGIEISGDIIPNIIDEIPILAVAAAVAKGKTQIRDAKELRVKESDRIDTVCKNLLRMGAKVTESDDGMTIEGVDQLNGSVLDSYEDHRIAMAFSVAAVIAKGNSILPGSQWADISYPGFFDILDKIRDVNVH